MTTRSAAAMIAFGASLVLTTAMACRTPMTRSGSIFGLSVAPEAFLGDSTSDSALYLYARAQTYQLLTSLGPFRTDSSGTAGSIDLCVQDGSTLTDYSALQDGKWRSLGCVIRSGPLSSDYPYLESGLSLILVRRSGPDWQAGVLGLSTRQIRRMFVSAIDTRPTLGSDARRFVEGPRIYVCYTCDRKACCPGNLASVSGPAQAQIDVDHIASVW
ncbi:MAG: hypothetical protein ABI877_21945 [Gemmatimonadaceae bacterium]